MEKNLIGLFNPFNEEGVFDSQALYDSIMHEIKRNEEDEDKEE